MNNTSERSDEENWGNEYENCVVCRDETNVLKSTPIKDRRFYVECVGQLDEKCYNKVYRKEEIMEEF
jgi:hypothetical protein